MILICLDIFTDRFLNEIMYLTHLADGYSRIYAQIRKLGNDSHGQKALVIKMEWNALVIKNNDNDYD